MAKQTDEKMFDQRVVARHIKRGLISAEDKKKYLESLEDCADMASDCETVFSYRVDADESESVDSAS
jgi:hypothetical protein